MGGGVTTGSLLNQRVFNRNGGSGSSNKGGGVQRHELLNTKITLADRNKGIGRTSYTALSNSINGRKEVIYVGGGSKYSGTSSMSTMEKIAMWNSIAQQGLQLGQGIAGLFKSGKSDAPAGTVKNQGVAPSGTDLKQKSPGSVQDVAVNSNTKVAGNDLASTLETLGFTDIDLTNIDYEQTANDFLGKMNKAKNSQDLYQALQGAKAYKQQVSARMAGMDISQMKKDLETLKGDAEGSVSSAKDGVNTADKAVKDQESQVKQGETQLKSARDSYDNTRATLAKTNEKFKNASDDVDKKTKKYDDANKALDTAKNKYDTAKTAARECTQARVNAETNTKQARANLEALQAQQNPILGTDSAALQVQVKAAEAQLKQAEAAEASAKKAESDAIKAQGEAEKAVNQAKTDCNTAKSNLTESRNTLSAVAAELKQQNQITESQYKQLTDRQTSLDNAEINLETQKKTLTEKQGLQEEAQKKLDELNAQKETLELQVHDYQEMQKASEKLGDLSKFETKLEEMMKKEQTTRDELQSKLEAQDGISNDTATSAKGRAKAEKKETKISSKLDKLNAGSAIDDIARDKALNSANKATMMSQTDTHKFDPFAKVKSSFVDAQSEQQKKDNEMQLNLLQSTGFATINGKTITKMPIGDSYMVEGRSYTFEQLKEALQSGQI